MLSAKYDFAQMKDLECDSVENIYIICFSLIVVGKIYCTALRVGLELRIFSHFS